MNGPRYQLAVARAQIVGLCERMGLEAYGEPLTRAYVQNSADETRRQLAGVRFIVEVIEKVVTTARAAAPGRDDSASAALASQLTVLDDAAHKAIVLCDAVVRERTELAAQGIERPVLNRARVAGRRAGDER